MNVWIRSSSVIEFTFLLFGQLGRVLNGSPAWDKYGQCGFFCLSCICSKYRCISFLIPGERNTNMSDAGKHDALQHVPQISEASPQSTWQLRFLKWQHRLQPQHLPVYEHGDFPGNMKYSLKQLSHTNVTNTLWHLLFFFRLSKVSYCTNKTRGSQMTQCCVKDNTRPWCSYSCFVTCGHFLPVFSSLPHDVAKFLFLASISHVSTCHIVTMYHPVYFHITCLSLQPGLLKTVGHIGRRGGYL